HEEYVLQKKDAEIRIFKKEKELSNVIMIAVISLGILILLIAILLFTKYRTKRRSNELLKQLNDQLNESNDQLLKINATKDKIFTIIAHDLKNPLSGFKNITSV